MVRHIVSWNFKPELDEATRKAAGEEIVSRMLALKELVPCIQAIQVFCPPLDSSNCDLALYVEVAQVDDLPRYKNHPDHQALTPLMRASFVDRRCVDIMG